MEDEELITRVEKVEDAKVLRYLRGSECLVEIYGTHLGQKFDLKGETLVTIGRDPANHIILDSDSVSRHHARMENTSSGWMVIDQASTNGTYVDDELITSRLLKGGEFVKIGDTIYKFLSAANIEAAYYDEIFKLTKYDGLTQVHNKRFLDDFLDREFSRCKRYNRIMTVMMLDLDHFKLINDKYGHLTGDYVLKEFAQTIAKRIRKEEVIARYGGEEFMVVLPESSLDMAEAFADIVRFMIEEHRFVFENQLLAITVSIGVAQIDADMKTVEDLVKRADENLYKAKNLGRNCVVAE